MSSITDKSVASSPLASEVINAIQSVVGSGPVALHEPHFDGNEWNYLKECLDSSYVSSIGPFVDRLERKISDFTGARHAVAVVNGTAALHIALKLVGVSNDDEVLIPALTFVATANAVAYCGAIPHFIDSEESTLGVDPCRLREYLEETTEIRNNICVNNNTGRVIKAIMPMHCFGHPVDMDGLLAVAKDFHLEVVEDAAESMGSLYHESHAGTIGRVGVLSFNGNKIITTGGGGAIITNDTELARRAKHLTTTARVPREWEIIHDEIGYNYRLPNINAALGCAQIERLPEFIQSKRRLFKQYKSAFDGVSNVSVLTEPDGCQSNYWLQALLLDESVAEHRNDILTATNDVGLTTRPTWTLLNRLPSYLFSPSMKLPVAESLQGRLINLPSSTYSAGA